MQLEGKEVSRVHADVRQEGPLYIVRDLQSRNGVFRNGERISEAALEAFDVLRIGEWIGRVVPAAEFSQYRQPFFSALAPGLLAGPKLAARLAPLQRAATSVLPVILQGETGTGKERVARALHAFSGRTGAFVAVNCAALPESLAEGELFGYRKGAFTGAERPSIGHFRAADGGTLLLDEITDMSLPLQAKLLRVLEEREVTPLGESSPLAIDVRVVAASQGSLQQAVAERRFRADLFARLDGLSIDLPPLRERLEDVPFLFMQLLRQHSGGNAPDVEARLIEELCLYDWPFNVRELNLTVSRLLALHDPSHRLKRSDLPERFLKRGESVPPAAAPVPEASDKSEKPVNRPVAGRPDPERDERDLSMLLEALRKHRGNVARAAAEVGIARQRAYRLMDAQVDLAAIRAQKNESNADAEPGEE
jgi:transcriptional regulator with PAS, ATPase and Fis domain